MKTFKIELRYDNEGDQRIDSAMRTVTLAHAKDLFAAAALVSGKRRPQIRVLSDDWFNGEAEIDLAEEDTDQEENADG